MRKLRFLALFAVVLVACGGGGHSPTEQPAVAQLTGTWRGLWFTSGVSFPSILTLSQSGGNLTGTIALLDSTFNIKGTATSSGMTWSAVGGGCGSLVGTGTVASLGPTEMPGTITLDTRGCTSSGFFDGQILWEKGSSAAAAPKAGRDFEALTATIKGVRP